MVRVSLTRRWHYKPWRTLLVFLLLVLSILSVNLFEDLSSASTFTDTTQSDFDMGTYNQTFYNSTGGFVQLNVTNTSGCYVSSVFNARLNSTWNNISWVSNAIGELPDNQQVETKFTSGNANMTGNILLMHMDNNWQDSSGCGNNGIARGGVGFTSSSKLGDYAGSFDGGDDYIDVVDDSSLNVTDSITIAAWVKPNDGHTDLIKKYGINWSDSSEWYNPGGFITWNSSENALNVQDYRNTYLTKKIDIDTTNGYYLECDIKHSPYNSRRSYSGTHSYATYTGSYLPGHPGSYDYFCDSGNRFSDELWYHRLNTYIGGAPRTGESSVTSQRDKWHTGTRYATIMFLFNYAGSGQKTHLKNLSFYEEETGISKRDSYELAFSNTSFSGKINRNRIKSDLDNEEWNHIAITYDRNLGSNQQKLYLNGNLVNQSSLTETINVTASDLTIYLNGSIDEVAIWNRSLSTDEIFNTYKRGALRLNLSVRTCNDPSCSGESWIDVSDASPQNFTIANNTYFQYKFNFSTDNSSFTPELYNVTINYNTLTVLDHNYVHTYQNNLPRSFFANNTQIQIRTNGTFESTPLVTITDSNGKIHIDTQNMIDHAGEYYYYNYTLNGSQGWYDVQINTQTWTALFYQGELWQDNYTDADGNPFSFRRRINVTEPGINKRWFEPIDIQVDFAYEPNNNSVRVLQYNGTHMLEIPSQIYNINQTSGALISANVVFLSTINKSEIRDYYVVTSKSDLTKSYTTDLTYSITSNQYTIANSYFTGIFNTNMGGLMQDIYDKIGTNNSLSGMEPIDYYPQFDIGLTTYSARSDTSVNVDTVEGPILYRFNVSGHANDDSLKPYSLSCKIYSKNQYMIYEKNQSTTATQNWKNLYINGLIFEDGSFTNVSYRTSAGDITTRALASGDNSDSTSLDTNMTWIAFYDTSLGNAVAELFLNKSFAATSDPRISITDDSDYDYYQHLLIDPTQTSVSSGSSFYTKTARMIYNGLQEYSIVNETYENLLNPLTIQQGTEETSDSENPSYSSTGNISSNDQNNATCHSYWTDDSYLSYAVINITGPGENGPATVLYQDASYEVRSSGSFTNKSWVNITLNASDINAGQINCNMTVYDVAGNSNSTLIQFNVSDTTSPCFTSVINEPDTNAGLDPNVQINITANITEYSNLSSVIVQYKNSSQPEWQNKSMNVTWNNSYNYNYSANFTPTTEEVWQYRIFANDSEGNSYTTNITNLTVYYDWTWERSPATFETKTGLLNETITLGNITINNTGDKPLSFKITSNWVNKNRIFFNDTAEGSGFSFNLSSGNSINVSVVVTASIEERSDDLTITINALNSSASPDYNTTTATIVSYASGPYLLVTITEYPSSVTQGDTGVDLTVQVQNKGNEIATNISLAWKLPPGWTVTSGSSNTTIENLFVDDIGYNSVVVSIGSSAPTGTKTLTARAGCSENKTGSDTASTVVVKKSGGGNGGSSGGYTPGEVAEMIIETILKGEKTLSSLEAFEIVRGYNDSFPVTVKNTLYENATLYNVSMSVTGYLSQYLQVSPEIIDEILYNETKEFNVTITSPVYMKKGTYQLNITISGKIVGHLLDMNLTDNRFVTLIIHEVSIDEANSSIAEAAGLIDDLATTGFQITKISRLLEDAQNAFNDHDYESAKVFCEEIKTIKEKAILASNLIQQITDLIENDASSRPMDETQTILNLAIAAFEREDYEIAFERAQNAMAAFSLEVKEFDILVFFFTYWWVILIGIVVATVAGIMLYRKMTIATITQKIRNLGREENNIRKLIVQAQKNRFGDKKISAGEYQRVVTRHRKRLIEIKGAMTKLRHKRVRLLKTVEVLRDLDRENVEIIALAKGLQEDYFKNRTIAKSDYADQTKLYNERLAEIEGERLTLEMMQAKGENKL